MTRSSRTLIGLVAGLGSVLAVSGSAIAHPTGVIQLSKGYGGPKSDNGGPGNEQATSAVVKKGGNTYVVTVYMNSDVSDNDAPYQCKCTSVLLSQKDSPKIMVDQKQISDYHNGDRLCNHPKLSSDGTHIVYTFGSDGNVDGQDNGNVQTYAATLDESCNMTSDPIRINGNANNNEGAPDVDYNGNGYFSAGYYANNDASYAVGLKLTDDGTKVSLEKTYLHKVVSPGNIGRPTIAAASATRTLYCAAQGDNRPPEDGIACVWLDAITGDKMWGGNSVIVAASDPGNHIYMNQPTVAKLDGGRFALLALESNGNGKKTNNKGANVSHLYVLEPNDNAPQMKDELKGAGSYQTHASICSGMQGTDGVTRIGLFDASPTGVGQPAMQFVSYDPIAKALQTDKFNDVYVVGFYGDSGYLANLYGQNPHVQGRDFLRCLGNVANPGYHVDGGYESDVKSFFVAPAAGRKPTEEKNALFLSFLPGAVDVAEPPEAPHEEDPTTGSGEVTTTGAGGAGAGATTGVGASDSTGANNGTPAPGPGQFNSGEPGGCACSMQDSNDVSPYGLLAAAGVAGMIVARRRRSSKKGS